MSALMYKGGTPEGSGLAEVWGAPLKWLQLQPICRAGHLVRVLSSG